MDAAVPCPHCQREITDNYCAVCGESRPRVLRPADLLGPSLEQLGQLDGPIRRTLAELVNRPADLIAAYWRGDRRHYSHPVKLLFWLTTLFVAALTLTGLYDAVVLVDEQAKPWLPVVLAFNSYLVFLYLLPAAWLARWHWAEPRQLTEIYVALLWLASLITLIKVLAMPLGYLWPDFTFWLNRFVTPAIYLWLLLPLLKGGVFARLLRALSIFALYFATSLISNTGVISLARLLEAVLRG